MNNEGYEQSYFLYQGKRYELRAQVPYRNKYLATLIEVERDTEDGQRSDSGNGQA